MGKKGKMDGKKEKSKEFGERKGRRDGWTGRKEMRREGRQRQTREEESRWYMCEYNVYVSVCVCVCVCVCVFFPLWFMLQRECWCHVDTIPRLKCCTRCLGCKHCRHIKHCRERERRWDRVQGDMRRWQRKIERMSNRKRECGERKSCVMSFISPFTAFALFSLQRCN